MTERKTRIYLAGPITGTKGYKSRFKWYQRQLEAHGFEVINPAAISAHLPWTFTHDEYIHVCLALLDTCSVIYIMPGSDQSEGVKIEKAYALHNHIGNITHLLQLPERPPGYR